LPITVQCSGLRALVLVSDHVMGRGRVASSRAELVDSSSDGELLSHSRLGFMTASMVDVVARSRWVVGVVR
jgi:hypothetical protein